MVEQNADPIVGAERQSSDRRFLPVGQYRIESDIAGTEYAGRNRHEYAPRRDAPLDGLKGNLAAAPVDTANGAVQCNFDIGAEARNQGTETVFQGPVFAGVVVVDGIFDTNLVGVGRRAESCEVIKDRRPDAVPVGHIGLRQRLAFLCSCLDGLVRPVEKLIERGTFRFRRPASVQEQTARIGALSIEKTEPVGDRNERVDARRMKPVASEIESDTRCKHFRIAPAANAMRSLDNDRGETQFACRNGGCQSRGSRADDRQIVSHVTRSLSPISSSLVIGSNFR